MTSAPLVHLVDDDDAVRDALGVMFGARGFRVRAYASATQCLAGLGRRPTGCLVADLRLPDMNALALLASLRARGSSLPAVVITAAAGAPLAVEAMAAGASDLLEKPFDDEALLVSVRRALATTRGGKAREAETRAVLQRFAALGEAEREVLAGIAQGRPSPEIAAALGLELRAVELHRANIMAKANVATLVELVRMSAIASAATRAPTPSRRRSNPRGAAAA
ncbi:MULTISPECIES: response regulator transcription factor [Methylosinus]|uniref:DNA-binding response regulator n=1 Tax=Methylosinus trichosporium (strain ATCC 35070 / NCIMB 11131 / UNIQEM 75 / OB3b) TaxID=595536 RepID=A0A2D2CZA7_METT3|nr:MULTISPECIES: response regulator [Methylosinus]ATQ68067.1 DNA-binding response regulator [Methylosinus trichosporium OB3b]OBS51516.1 LuxR family transcriptional regulator [Methylosinus sp. 3S-1]